VIRLTASTIRTKQINLARLTATVATTTRYTTPWALTPPRTAIRLINEWVGLHRDEFVANWERAQALQPLLPIEPLR